MESQWNDDEEEDEYTAHPYNPNIRLKRVPLEKPASPKRRQTRTQGDRSGDRDPMNPFTTARGAIRAPVASARAQRHGTPLEPGVTHLQNLPRPSGAQQGRQAGQGGPVPHIGAPSFNPFRAVPLAPGSPAAGPNGQAGGLTPDELVERQTPTGLQMVRYFIQFLREQGNLVYLFATEFAAVTSRFKVEDVLNVHVNQIDPVEFAKAYPWVVQAISPDGTLTTRVGPYEGEGGGQVPVQSQMGRNVGTGQHASFPSFRLSPSFPSSLYGDPALAVPSTHELQAQYGERDVYGIGAHLHGVVADFQQRMIKAQQRANRSVQRPMRIGEEVAAPAPASAASASRYRTTALVRMPSRTSPGDGTFSVYNTMLLKPEVMGLVRQALADVNQWHAMERRNQTFIFDDMLPNATVRSFFARYVAFVRARAHDVGGNQFTSVNQYGMPFTRSSGKTHYQLQEQYQTMLTARRFFLSLRKGAGGQVTIGTFAGETQALRTLQEREARSGSNSRFSVYSELAGGDVLASVLGVS